MGNTSCCIGRRKRKISIRINGSVSADMPKKAKDRKNVCFVK